MNAKLIALMRLLFSPTGTVDWPIYLVATIAIFALKFPLDVWFAGHAGHDLDFAGYWRLSLFDGLQFAIGWAMRSPFGFLAIPFVWSGLMLAAKRMRSIGWPPMLVLLFLVPILNYFFLAILATIHATRIDLDKHALNGLRHQNSKKLGSDAIMSSISGAILGIVLSLGLVVGCWGNPTAVILTMFFACPFFAGALATIIYGTSGLRSFQSCFGVSILASVLSIVALQTLNIEGLSTMILAFPVLGFPSLFGTMLGFLVIQSRSTIRY